MITKVDKKKSLPTFSRINMISLIVIASVFGFIGSNFSLFLGMPLKTSILVIEDDAGEPRIIMSAIDGLADITFYNQEGTPSLYLTVTGSGHSSIRFHSTENNSGLLLTTNGPNHNPQLLLQDQWGHVRWDLYLDETGSPVIRETTDTIDTSVDRVP